MIIKKGDYAFTADDVRPHRWGLKIGGDVLPSRWFKVAKPADKVVELERVPFSEHMKRIAAKPKLEQVLGTPVHYFVADNGSFAGIWPRPDKDYELVRLDADGNSEKSA